MLLVFTISLGAILAGSASAEPRSTSSHITFDITFEDQRSAAVQAATDNKRSVEDQMTSRENRIVATRHQVDVAGRVLKYTARAGRLPILDNETGQVHAMMFFTSYTLDSPPDRDKLRQPQRKTVNVPLTVPLTVH